MQQTVVSIIHYYKNVCTQYMGFTAPVPVGKKRITGKF